MILSWNEIKDRALLFSKEWADAYNEEAEAKPFLEAFFNVFGITRRKVATFEERVKNLDAHDGYIDLLWKATILVEMKSKGKDLDKAIKQAKDYVDSLPQHHLPKYILVCDFEHFRLLDLEENTEQHFLLKDLVKNVQHFAPVVCVFTNHGYCAMLLRVCFEHSSATSLPIKSFFKFPIHGR